MNIWTAAADGNSAKVKEFLANGQTPNSKDENGYTPIHAAAEWGHADLLKYLLENGGDINVTDSDGDTPLHATESPAIAKLLVELGADPKKKNSDGLTPLEKAVEEDTLGEAYDLVAFFKELNGEKVEPRPENMKMSVNYADEAPEGTVDPEQRKKLEEIIEHGNDEDFERFLKETLAKKEQEAAETPTKKTHTEETPTKKAHTESE